MSVPRFDGLHQWFGLGITPGDVRAGNLDGRTQHMGGKLRFAGKGITREVAREASHVSTVGGRRAIG
jgi:hypothetical protein